MDEFVRAHEQDVIGVLNGFDRLVLRGTLRRLAPVGGMASYRHAVGVLLKDFGAFADQQTKRLREASMAAARRLQRPIVYLSRPQISKEETARAIAAFGSEDVMRFLGRKPHGAFQGEVISSYRGRTEGVRIRHTVQGNSVKAYDKAGQLLRIETTINSARGFKVYRPREGDGEGRLDGRPMRKGIADLHRRTRVSQAAPAFRPTSATPAPWRRSRSSVAWARRRRGSARRLPGKGPACAPCVPSQPTITRCSRPSLAASSPSTACATVTSWPSFIRASTLLIRGDACQAG
jgi:ribosomal protein S6E (S10)